MPTKTGKLTRAEKREINKKAYQEVKEEAKKERKIPEIKEKPKTKEEKKKLFCELIAECTRFDVAAKMIGSSHPTIYSWLDKDKNFLTNYTRARELQAEKLVEDMLEIADNSEGDLISDENGERINHEVVARSRLRVETRKWIAAKMKPRVYGDSTKIQAEVKDTSNTNEWLDEILTKTDKNK